MNQHLWIEDLVDENQPFTVINSSRIGLGKSAEEWANAPFRYYIFKNGSVSKIDKKAEAKYK